MINHHTPLEKLFDITPNYNFLQVFGCACWPNLRPYNARKLEFRSKLCVFLGYTDHHKGHKCLHKLTSRIYISCDFTFDEHLFPFAKNFESASTTVSPSTDTILLPTFPP